MKIKKSELLALIKEEIMDEMRGLTTMDDPYDDDAVPAGMEQGGAMDQVAEMIENAVLTSMDDLIAMISNFLVTTQGNRDVNELMLMGMDMLQKAGFREPAGSAIEKMIEDEMGDGYYDDTYYADGDPDAPDLSLNRHLREGIGLEEMEIVRQVAVKLAPLLTFVSLPVLIGALVEQIKKEGKGNRKKRGEM